MKYQIGLPILVLAFSACMKIKKKDEAVAAATVTVNEVQVEQQSVSTTVMQKSDLQIEYKGQANPNQYSAVLNWPKNTASTFRILNPNNEIIDNIDSNYTISELAGGKEYKIIFEQFDLKDQKRLAVFDIILLPPIDLAFDHELNMIENLDYNIERLFLTSRAKIYTNQYHLNIKAKYIYSDYGALITNFPIGSVATTDTVGLSGGKIDISTTEAIGSLQVIMNAQQGGQGSWGTPSAKSNGLGYQQVFLPSGENAQFPACYGRAGANGGQAGAFFLKIKLSGDFKVSAQMSTASGGAAGDMDMACYNSKAFINIHLANFKKCRDMIDPNNCEQRQPSLPGLQGNEGQICLKMSEDENYKCNGVKN
jgi:hypothetical protein